MTVRNKSIIVNNLLVNYYYLEPKNPKKTLLFLHGWGTDSTSWFGLIDKLKNEQYQLYFLDLPGFGRSQVPSNTFNLDDYVKIVDQFIHKLGLNNANLIGHSFGGRIAIKLTAGGAKFIDKIILVDAAGINSPNSIKKIALLLAKMIKPFFTPDFMQPLRKKLYFLIGSEYLDHFELSKIFSRVVSENLTPLLPRIKNQTLIVWGSRDTTTPIYYAELMKKLIKRSKLVIFEGAGHFPFIDDPGRFATEFIKFL